MNTLRFNRGISLVEMMIVASILAMAAAIVVPTFQSRDPEALEHTVSEVKQALIYARDEAIRTTLVHGLEIDDTARTVTVVQADTEVLPLAPSYNVYHPSRKQPYTLDLSPHQTTVAPVVVWAGNCTNDLIILFDRYGRARCINDFSVTVDTALINVSMRNLTTSIMLDGQTGRITTS